MSLLENLRKKGQKPSVPGRVDELIDGLSHPQLGHDEPHQSGHDEPKLLPIVRSSPLPDPLSELQAQLDQLPKTDRHGTITLQVELGKALTAYCKEKNITVETFLEAAWAVLQDYPELLEYMTIEAKRRYDERKTAGKLRKLITQIGKTYSG